MYSRKRWLIGSWQHTSTTFACAARCADDIWVTNKQAEYSLSRLNGLFCVYVYNKKCVRSKSEMNNSTITLSINIRKKYDNSQFGAQNGVAGICIEKVMWWHAHHTAQRLPQIQDGWRSKTCIKFIQEMKDIPIIGFVWSLIHVHQLIIQLPVCTQTIMCVGGVRGVVCLLQQQNCVLDNMLQYLPHHMI